MTLRLRGVNEHDARLFASWEYPEPYSMYNSSVEDVPHYLDAANGYHTVVEGDEVVGLCCFGVDARVPGGTYDDDSVDFGTGMRPDLTGRGRGTAFIELVCREARQRWPGKPLRTTVAAFNERAQHLVRKLGFQEVELFRNPAGREFTIFVKD